MGKMRAKDRKQYGGEIGPSSVQEKENFDKALLKLQEKLKEKEESSKLKEENAIKDRKDSAENYSSTKDQKPIKAEEPAEDPDFQKYFAIFASPDLTDKEEVVHIKKLIGEKKSALIKQLVLELATVPGAGKSVIFKSLAKKFGAVNDGVAKKDEPKAESSNSENKDEKEGADGMQNAEAGQKSKSPVLHNDIKEGKSVELNNVKESVPMEENNGKEEKQVHSVQDKAGKTDKTVINGKVENGLNEENKKDNVVKDVNLTKAVEVKTKDDKERKHGSETMND